MGLTPPVVCLVTDGSRLESRDPEATELADLLALIATAARAGVDLIQVREPDLDDRVLCRLVSEAVSATVGTPARIIVNDRPDVALASGAAGVHLKAGSSPAARVRSLAPPDWLIGRSVHSAEEADQAAASGGLDYLFLGTVFETASKPGQAPVGEAVLREAVRRVDLPVLAIGGVTRDTATAVGQTGAAGLAAIGPFALAAGKSARAWSRLVADLRQRFDTGRHSTL